MFKKILLVNFIFVLFSCAEKDTTQTQPADLNLVGTWKLLSGTLIENGDTTITKYDDGISFIKIINPSHFAFLQHDLNKGKDSTAVYSSGGGSYSLVGDSYTEHLEYCSAREWEDHDFTFKMTMSGDTLIQSGLEKVEETGVERYNTEVYQRMK